MLVESRLFLTLRAERRGDEIAIELDQLGEELGQSDVVAIVSWLGALTGELPAR